MRHKVWNMRDYPARYAGISGTKIDGVPRNPG
jgi:hypothetical protein